MTHLKPISKAILGTNDGFLGLIQLLVAMGLLDIEDIFKKDGEPTV